MDAIVIYSIIFGVPPPYPPATNPRVPDEQPPAAALRACVKSPKFVAFPVDANVI